MKELTLEELRACELGCLKALHSFCEENGLKYYLAFGSLIGAVRHKGFIPWDDDIDILMPREDYNYLLMHFSSEKYRLISFKNEPKCYTPFAKLIDTATVLKEEGQTLETGAFVDVFPLDKLPNNTLKRFLFEAFIWARENTLIAATRDLSRKRPLYKQAAIVIASFLYRKKNPRELYFNWEYPQKYRDRKDIRYYGLLYKPFSGLPVLEADWFSRQIPVEFEGECFYAPCGYDPFLRYCYGDYWQLPPAAEQKTHHRFTCWWRDAASETAEQEK